MHVVNQQIINELYSLFNSIFVDSALAKKNRYKFNEKIINDREGPINGSFDHIRKSFMTFRILIFVFVCILEINLNLFQLHGKNICEVCNKKFASEANLKRHQEIHEVKKVCPHCSATFSFKDGLKRHIKTQHEVVCMSRDARKPVFGVSKKSLTQTGLCSYRR